MRGWFLISFCFFFFVNNFSTCSLSTLKSFAVFVGWVKLLRVVAPLNVTAWNGAIRFLHPDQGRQPQSRFSDIPDRSIGVLRKEDILDLATSMGMETSSVKTSTSQKLLQERIT
jgi:hypothetical protein